MVLKVWSFLLFYLFYEYHRAKSDAMTDNHEKLFGAVVKRAILDAGSKRKAQAEDAKQFLDYVFPSWPVYVEKHGRPRKNYHKRMK